MLRFQRLYASTLSDYSLKNHIIYNVWLEIWAMPHATQEISTGTILKTDIY